MSFSEDAIRVRGKIVDVTQAGHPYGRTLGSNYFWGCNGTELEVCNELARCLQVLTGDKKYRGTQSRRNQLYFRSQY